MTTGAELRARVRRGVEWLDAVRPDWRTKVKVRELEMPDGCRCVLGQVFSKRSSEGFWRVTRGRVKDVRLTVSEAVEMGFHAGSICFADLDPEYQALQNIWTEELVP